jgi:hypothetical protein
MARVLTFGYNADFVLNFSTFGIKDHALKLLTSLRDKREEIDVSEFRYATIVPRDITAYGSLQGAGSSSDIRLPQLRWNRR